MKKQTFSLHNLWITFILFNVMAFNCEAQIISPSLHWQFTKPSKYIKNSAKSKSDYIFNMIEASDGSLFAVGSYQDTDNINRSNVIQYYNNNKQILMEMSGSNTDICLNKTDFSGGVGSFQDVVEVDKKFYAVGSIYSGLCLGEIHATIAKISTPQHGITFSDVIRLKVDGLAPINFSGVTFWLEKANSIRPIVNRVNGRDTATGFIVCGTTTIFGISKAYIIRLKMDLSRDSSFGNKGFVLFDDFTVGKQAIVHYNSSNVPDGYYISGILTNRSILIQMTLIEILMFISMLWILWGE